MEIELKHTWRISRRKWYIRLYLWAWQAREQDITFCKIFWAYMFMWFALPSRSMMVVMGWVARSVWWATCAVGRACRRVWVWLAHRREVAPVKVESYTAPLPPPPPPREASPVVLRQPPRPRPRPAPKRTPVMIRLLTWIETLMTRSSMRRQAIVYAVRQTIVAVGHGLRAIGRPIGGTALMVAQGVGLLIGGLMAVAWCLATVLRITTSWVYHQAARVAPVVERAALMVEQAVVVLARVIWTMLLPARVMARQIDGRLSRVAGGFAWSLAILVGLFYVIPLVFLAGWLLAHPAALLPVVLGFTAVAGFALALGFGLAFIAERWLVPTTLQATVQVARPVKYATKQSIGAISEGTVGFGKVMLIGYKAVKSNTCPKVEVED